MNFAQRLVGKKFKNVWPEIHSNFTQVYQGSNELHEEISTNFALQNKSLDYCLHNTELSKGTIYNSLFDSVDGSTTGILKKLFGPKVEVVVNNDRKLIGVDDCGLFAIVNCIILAERSLPESFDQSKMRLYLVKYIEELNFTTFPCTDSTYVILAFSIGQLLNFFL